MSILVLWLLMIKSSSSSRGHTFIDAAYIVLTLRIMANTVRRHTERRRLQLSNSVGIANSCANRLTKSERVVAEGSEWAMVKHNFAISQACHSNAIAMWCYNVVVRLSVCLSSVTFVHPTQATEIFGNVFRLFGTLDTHWHPGKILRRSSQGNPFVMGVKRKRGGRI